MTTDTDGTTLAALLLSVAATALALLGWFAADAGVVRPQVAAPSLHVPFDARWLLAGLVGHFLACVLLLAGRRGMPLPIALVALLRCTTLGLLAFIALNWFAHGRADWLELVLAAMQVALWVMVETRPRAGGGSLGNWPSTWVPYGMAVALTTAGAAAWDRGRTLRTLSTDALPNVAAAPAGGFEADASVGNEPPEPATPHSIAAAGHLPAAGRGTAATTAEAATVRVVNRTQALWGSGTIISVASGAAYVLTASHLVAAGEETVIETSTRSGLPASAAWADGSGRGQIGLVLQDVANDLALLRVPLRASASPPPHVAICPLADAPTAGAVAAWAVFCDEQGHPHSAADTVIASRIRRRSGGDILHVWEGERPGLRGDSGGALVDRRGRLIGVRSGIGDGKPYYCHLFGVHALLARHEPLAPTRLRGSVDTPRRD